MEDQLTSIYDIFTGFLNDALSILPEFITALVVLVAFIVAGRLSRRGARKVAGKVFDDPSLQSLTATITSTVFIVVGLFVSAALLFPGLEAGDLVGVLGLSSVAVGFAFKDIFQNFLAGVLILSRRPFKIGDQIETNSFEGTVEDISFRSTELITFDGEKVVIPNSSIFTNPVTVQTARPLRRSRFSTGIGYDHDIETARQVIIDAVGRCDLVETEPGPTVRVTEHGSSSVNFDVLFWTKSDQSSGNNAKDQVATAVKYALDDAGIEIPFPQQTLHLGRDMVDADGALPLVMRSEGRSDGRAAAAS
jgi:small-conductance mechanosensitive channel